MVIGYKERAHAGTNQLPFHDYNSSAEQISIQFSYNSGLIQEEYAKEIRDHFEHVLMQMIDKGEGRLRDITLLTPSQEHRLLYEFNDTAWSIPRTRRSWSCLKSRWQDAG